MSFDFYLYGRARNEEHFRELWTALRTFDFQVEAAYVAASVSAIPPVIITDPPEPPAPMAPWWAALKAEDKVKLARLDVHVYYEPVADESKLWNRLSDGRTMDVFGVRGDWIQVKHYPPYNLWVQAADVVPA